MAGHRSADGLVRIRGARDAVRAWQDCRQLAALIARARGEKRSRPCQWSNPALARRAFVRFRHALVVQAMKSGVSWEEIQAVLPKNVARAGVEQVAPSPATNPSMGDSGESAGTTRKARGAASHQERPVRYRPRVD